MLPNDIVRYICASDEIAMVRLAATSARWRRIVVAEFKDAYDTYNIKIKDNNRIEHIKKGIERIWPTSKITIHKRTGYSSIFAFIDRSYFFVIYIGTTRGHGTWSLFCNNSDSTCPFSKAITFSKAIKGEFDTYSNLLSFASMFADISSEPLQVAFTELFARLGVDSRDIKDINQITEHVRAHGLVYDGFCYKMDDASWFGMQSLGH
jgi:hypothetical protein